MKLHNIQSVDSVFCDSLQALEWAYNNGLSRSVTIKTSAPAMLLSKKQNIQNIESRWSTKDIEKFQKTINKLTKDIFDAVLNIDDSKRELALVFSKSAFQFQKVLYKSACLDEDDFSKSRLFIYVDGEVGPAGNVMNSPWDKLLSVNTLFSKINYKLKNDEWNTLTTDGVSFWKRFKVAGYETIVYRLAIKFMKMMPNWFFKKELLLPNENELNIEIASSMALRGVKITKIQPEHLFKSGDVLADVDIALIYEAILPIMYKRVENWVTPSAVKVTMELFKLFLEKKLDQFTLLVSGWEKAIVSNSKIKQTVLMNAPGNINGYALAYVCRKRNIPLISSQHGVTVEISKAHSMMQVNFDNSVADIVLSYNSTIVDIEKNTYFDKSKHYVVGMPLRLIRMNHSEIVNKYTPPIVYVSSNTYMGFSVSQRTDYINAKAEQKIITEVLGKLPHKVRYKTYPLDNRRSSDVDPVLNSIEGSNNIEVFSDKVDMRYLISEHRITITSQATSTLGWLVMSGKPLVFINKKYDSPLTDDSKKALSKGLFVFDDDNNLHNKLRSFLSKPIDEIEELWENKEKDREDMIINYFSTYKNGAGKRASQIILRECYT